MADNIEQSSSVADDAEKRYDAALRTERVADGIEDRADDQPYRDTAAAAQEADSLRVTAERERKAAVEDARRAVEEVLAKSDPVSSEPTAEDTADPAEHPDASLNQ